MLKYPVPHLISSYRLIKAKDDFMHKLIGLFYKFLYQLNHHYLFEIRLRTWVSWILAMLAILLLLVRLPGSLEISIFLVGIVLVLTLGNRWARRRDYIHFSPTRFTAPTSPPSPITLDETILHDASGPFSVEGKEANWTHLSARYRTFRDREHVIMAQLTPTSLWGVGAPDATMLGMWYFFIKEEQIISLTAGKIYWGGEVKPGLKLRFQKNNAQGKRDHGVFYLHFNSEMDLHRVWADLTPQSYASSS